MSWPVKVPGSELFADLGNRIRRQEHRPEHGLLGLDVLRGLMVVVLAGGSQDGR
ncbi:hypothetical protein ACFSVJ_31045 [Prauserella oleivorans]